MEVINEKLKDKALSKIIEFLEMGVTNIHKGESCDGMVIYGEYNGKVVMGCPNKRSSDENTLDEQLVLECLSNLEISPYDAD